MAITAFLSRPPGLLNREPGGPASLGHGPHSSIFSPTGLNSNWVNRVYWAPPPSRCWFSLLHLISNRLNFLSPGLYDNLTSTLLPASVTILHSIQPVHGQSYILIFLDRMHLLFTQMHFLFWQFGRVEQYATPLQLFGVVAIEKGASGSPLTTVTNFNELAGG